MRFEWEGVLNDPVATTPGTDCVALAPGTDLDVTSDKCLEVLESNV